MGIFYHIKIIPNSFSCLAVGFFGHMSIRVIGDGKMKHVIQELVFK